MRDMEIAGEGGGLQSAGSARGGAKPREKEA
jgi:hypothetical protein